MRLIRSLCVAFSTYSRIPVPQVEWSDENCRYAMCFFPAIGAVIGAVTAAWLWVCGTLRFGAFLQGAVGAAIPMLITGGIHMDGFMDTVDAMASWRSPEERHRILKDSHTGAFSVMACAMYLLCFAGVMSEAVPADAPAVAAVFVLSRAASAWTLIRFRRYGQRGMLSSIAEKQQRRAVSAACAVWFAAARHWGRSPPPAASSAPCAIGTEPTNTSTASPAIWPDGFCR